jgi:hypothetical protein
MPNWVHNGLTIEGNPEQVKALMAQMNRPFVMKHHNWNTETAQMEQQETKYSNPVFAFHNIYSYIDHGVSEKDYFSQKVVHQGETFADWIKFETNDWYNFNCREWGTKWDVGVVDDDTWPSTTVEDQENDTTHVAFYKFETAWARPMEALIKLSKQYPILLFTLSYEEETGWGGELELLRGEIISESEYSNVCRECDGQDCLTYSDETGIETCTKCGWEN